MNNVLSPRRLCAGLVVLLLALAVTASCMGAIDIPFSALWRTESQDYYRDILLNIRLPRVLLALLVGAALSTAGVIMQGLFRNPMADPGLLGVSSGSALMVGVAIVFPVVLPAVLALYEQMLFAVFGSLAICALIFLLSARSSSGGVLFLLLAGIAINALCGAAIGILSYVGDEQQLRQLTLWMMGSLGQAQWTSLLAAASLALPAMLLAWRYAEALNLLQLGEEEAHYLGLNVRRSRQTLLLLSSLLIGGAVAVSGIIGFIGLVVPHLIRMTSGANHRWLLPCSALCGACLLLLADTLARTLVQPAEMPVGLLSSLIGAPYFLWLIFRSRRAAYA
ncbi:FecCD family ABC transporter permease [Mixta intestinalis]|uniref:Hemin transport system permease protein HmuU n=1 Tax=Mixta intestinalis TaxID=1615494 RepID=A0A6P1Q3F7_9GAMM|nr:iron ABC transporter permease [Mixta intestinalis]QHM72385.1 Hemin transport system permease protein HmuU [Mixta intestinalis]